jgi:hypothetical protein
MARSLRAVSFFGNQSIRQSVHGPGNDLVALDGTVVKTYLLEIDFDSAGSDRHRIGRHP